MNHFIEISQLSRQQIEQLVQRALHFKSSQEFPSYSHYQTATLFYENSTRTRVSFELAARHLNMPMVNLDIANSSENKGELVEDTLSTLAAMGINLFVIRHRQEGIVQQLANHLANSIQLVNAGDGKHAHPSQAMLDLMTIVEHKKQLTQLKVAIVGDLRHSRVANSLQCLFATMQVDKLMLVAPPIWQPQQVHYGEVTDNLRQGLEGADVVVCLRVQQERLAQGEELNLQTYRDHYAITSAHLAWAKKEAIVMHPGPVNRGIEVDSDVVDGPQSVILQQVTNGVYMRMAILEALATAV